MHAPTGAVEQAPNDAGCFVHLRQLGKRPTRDDVHELASRFGRVLWVARFYGRGSASVQFAEAEHAAALLRAHAVQPLSIGDRAMQAEPGRRLSAAQYAIEDESTDARIESECRRAVDDLIRRVATNVAHENQRANNGRRRRRRRLVKQARRDEAPVRTDVCWDFASKGSCSRGASCSFAHTRVDVASLPARMRWLTERDTFTAERAASPFKTRLNALLGAAAAGLQLPCTRALVLDGASCGTTRSLRAAAELEVHVPNFCVEAHAAQKASGLCHGHLGSVRSLLERLSPALCFGLVYLDYCCRLSAGRNAHTHWREKSPIDDLRLLFGQRRCDAGGCVLALCVRAEADGTLRESAAAALRLVGECAERGGRQVRGALVRYDAPQEMFGLALLVVPRPGAPSSSLVARWEALASSHADCADERPGFTGEGTAGAAACAGARRSPSAAAGPLLSTTVAVVGCDRLDLRIEFS